MNASRGGDPDAAAIAAAARAWLSEAGASFGAPAALAAPRIISGPAGEPDGWFVPLLAGEQLLGYLRFTADGTRRGLSSFQRQRGDLSSCPLAADWLDPDRVAACARRQATPDATASAPLLTYDGSPERLAWRVDFTAPNGQRFSVCVAGMSAWRCDGPG